jgi:exonuclease VII large subunit
MKIIITILFLIIAPTIYAQDTIPASKAKENLGKEVWVKGTVASLRLASEGKFTNYINIDKAYPNNIFTIVITNKHLEKLNINLNGVQDKVVLVKGTIEIYDKDPKQIPQIYNPTAIIFK